jgi:cyclic pyranopterin phosphate synthase
MPQPDYEIVAGRVLTRSLEVHIVDHCNLRCHACCSLSPYLPKWFIDPADLERDLRLACSALAPQYLKLVGGEPSLHPALDECLAVARRVLIAPVVSVTTNGFLLPRASDRFWQLTQALTISLYPHPRLPDETISLIEKRAGEFGIPINWKQQGEFVEMDIDEPRADASVTRNIYHDCWLRRRCHIVSHGRFYTCTRPPHFETFYGNDAGFRDDGLVLETGPDMAGRLRAYLQRPEPLKACSLCQGGSAPSRPHRQMSAAEVQATVRLRRA